MFEALQEPEAIDPDIPLDDQLIRWVTLAPEVRSRRDRFKRKISKSFKKFSVVTSNGTQWFLGDIFLRCGVEVDGGAHFWLQSSKMNPLIFGYCFSVMDEVRSRGMVQCTEQSGWKPITLPACLAVGGKGKAEVSIGGAMAAQAPPQVLPTSASGNFKMQVASWSVEDVCQHFAELGAQPEHLDAIRRELVNGAALANLTREDLRNDMKFPLGLVARHFSLLTDH